MVLSLECDVGPWARVRGLGWWRRQESLPSCPCPRWHGRRKCTPVAPSGAGLWWLERMLCTHPGDAGTSHWDIGTEGEGVCGSAKAFEVSLLHSAREVEGITVILHPGFLQGPKCLSGWVCWDVGEAVKELLQTSAVKHHFFPSLFLSLFQIPALRFLSFQQRQLPRSSLGFKVPKITKVKIN